MPLKPHEAHAYLKIQSINGSCFEQYSFPIAITIVIIFVVLEVVIAVIVTVIMVLLSFTNLANLRWLWSCWHLCPSYCPWGGTQVLARAQSLGEFTGGKHGGCLYIVRAVIFGLVILVPYLVICLCYIHIVCKLRNSRQDLVHCCAIFLCYLDGEILTWQHQQGSFLEYLIYVIFQYKRIFTDFVFLLICVLQESTFKSLPKMPRERQGWRKGSLKVSENCSDFFQSEFWTSGLWEVARL